MKKCLPVTDIKYPVATILCAEGLGANGYSGAIVDSSNITPTLMTAFWTDPGNYRMGNTNIMLRHGNRKSYNLLFFDGHVSDDHYPNQPQSISWGWCSSN